MRRGPRDTGPLTDRDKAEIDAFRRFLALNLEPGDTIPDEWKPYALGTGPAPTESVRPEREPPS